VKKNPGVSLGVVAWLKTRHIMLSVGQNIFQVSANEKLLIQVLLHQHGTQEGEQYPLVVDILEESCVPILLWDTGIAIPYPCSRTQASALVCESFEIFLRVSVPDSINSCDSWITCDLRYGTRRCDT
jgi:hypothetical protein